ncbi:MAG: hypothetical protein ACI86X_002622 [Moritella sp.]|jgi:hypothetical protein
MYNTINVSQMQLLTLKYNYYAYKLTDLLLRSRIFLTHLATF